MAETGIDVKRVSLLDVVNSKQNNSPDDSRVTCVAKLTEHLTAEKAKQMKAKFDRAMKQVLDDKGGTTGSCTGMLLAFPGCLVMQLEAAAHVVNALLEAIHETPAAFCISQLRVVSMTDGIPARAHSAFHFAFAAGDAKAHAEAVDAALAVKTASDLNLGLLSFGKQTRDLEERDLQDALDNITAFWETMPRAETILSLTQFADAPSLVEFLELFNGPVNVDLESERVWPMPKMPELPALRL